MSLITLNNNICGLLSILWTGRPGIRRTFNIIMKHPVEFHQFIYFASIHVVEASKSVSAVQLFTSTRIWTWNSHSKSEYVFYYTMEGNFVVLARFQFLFNNIIDSSKSVSAVQLFTSTRIWTWNPHSKSEYVFYYTIEGNLVVMAGFLFLFNNIVEIS